MMSRSGTSNRSRLFAVLLALAFGSSVVPTEAAASDRIAVTPAGALVAAVPGAGVVDALLADAPLADAARDGDLEQVRALIGTGADVNAAHGDGMTALHWAAERGSVEMVEVLIYAGANAKAVTRIGDYTPLHLAAKSGSADVLRALIAAGAVLDARTTTGGASPLHFAAASGSTEAVAALVDAGAEVDARERAWGQTPLMFAAAKGHTKVVEALLSSGANSAATSNVVDVPRQATADRLAGQRRDQVLEDFRAETGPDDEAWRPSPAQVQAAVRAARTTPEAGEGHTGGRDEALNAQRQEAGPEEAIQQNQPFEPDLNAPGNEQAALSYADLVGSVGGMTALLHAVREGHGPATRSLLDAGADINQPSAGDGTTPLLMAVVNGHFDLALELLDRGADPNLASDAGTTPLFAAINTHWAPKARYPQQQAYQQQESTYLDVMRAVLAAGADANARLNRHLWFMEYTFSHLGINTTGATPFWRAAHALDVEAMRLLVEHGADPGLPTLKAPERRFRPAPEGGDPSGLPPVPIGGPGVYPIHVATGHGYGTGYAGNSHRHAPDAWMDALIYLVEEHGADVNARDQGGYTPLHNAASRGDTEMIRYLVERGADVMAVSRRGQTTVDMANGPQQRIQPFPEAIALLESLGAKNNHNCLSC